jgi:hypothetical protein
LFNRKNLHDGYAVASTAGWLVATTILPKTIYGYFYVGLSAAVATGATICWLFGYRNPLFTRKCVFYNLTMTATSFLLQQVS